MFCFAWFFRVASTSAILSGFPTNDFPMFSPSDLSALLPSAPLHWPLMLDFEYSLFGQLRFPSDSLPTTPSFQALLVGGRSPRAKRQFPM